MRRPIIPLLLSLATLAAHGVEIPVATPFAVRKEVAEVLDDLAKIGTGGESAALIQRVRDLLERHGAALIQPRGGAEAKPLAEILADALNQTGLAAKYAQTWRDQAAERLALARGDDELALVAQTYLGTPAAVSAARMLADRAWDAGRLGRFVALAQKAGDTGIPARQARLAAADRLVAQPSLGSITALADAPEIWRLGIELRPAVPPRMKRVNTQMPMVGIPGLSSPLADTVGLADGRSLTIVDHLVGAQVAPSLAVGNTPLARRQAIPATSKDLFVAVGVLDQQRIVLVAADTQGNQRWRTATPSLGFNPIVAAPVIQDRLAITAAVVQDNEGAVLRVLAFDLATGSLAWDTTVGRLGSPRAWMFAIDQQSPLVPALVVTADGLVVLSNGGVIARLDTTGVVARVWSYRGADPAGDAPTVGHRRLGSLATDGKSCVICPVDLPGVVLILEGAAPPRPYTGDGADGDILGLRDGIALLSSARLVALDLATNKPRWIAPGAGATETQAVLGSDSFLISGKEALLTLDRETGLLRSSRRLEQPVSVSATREVLILATSTEPTSTTMVGHGATVAVTTRLQAAAAADPKDYRSVVSLASLAAATGEATRALDLFQEALNRGAPAEAARRAMTLLRRRLDRADPAPEDLQRLARLVVALPDLAGEAGWWQGRAAERRGDRTTAIASYQAACKTPDVALALVPGLEVGLHHLAERALARLQPQTLPTPGKTSLIGGTSMVAWKQRARRARGTLVGGAASPGGPLAVGYADGVLVAHRLADGQERWWRRPDRPLLGVQSRPDTVGEGIPLTVVPGTSAATAGLLTGDILLRLNDKAMRSFTADLVPTVVGLGVRGRFKALVRRGEQHVICEGALGGELVEPNAANARTVLIWPISPVLAGGGNPGRGAPEGQWVAALDIADGSELWRATVPPTTAESRPARPLLTDDDLVILVDGPDLVARSAHAGPGELWRLPGLAGTLEDAQILASGYLWLPATDRSRLVRIRDGRILATVAADPLAQVLLAGDDLLVRAPDGSLTAWDLAWGVDRWRGSSTGRLVDAAGDALWTLTSANALQILDMASGVQRRLYGEWTSISEFATLGDRIQVIGSSPSGTQVASISRRGGSVLWQQPLPQGLQAGDLRLLANGDTALSLSANPNTYDVLALDAEGRIVQAESLGGEPTGRQLALFPDGILDCTDQGLATTPRANLPLTTPVPLGSDQFSGGIHWRLVRGEGGLDLRVRFPPGSTGTLDFRLAAAGTVIDATGWKLLIHSNGSSEAPTTTNGWLLDKVARVDDEIVAHLSPPLLGGVRGGAVVVRAVDTDQVTPGPGWLTAIWRPVTGGP